MKKHGWLSYVFSLTSLTLFSGCLTYRSQSAFLINKENLVALQNQCEAIDSTGSLMEVSRDVEYKRREIMRILQSTNPNRCASSVTSLASEISSDFALLKSLSRPEWVNAYYPYELRWSIRPGDLRVPSADCDDDSCATVIKSVTLNHAFIQGREVDPLLSNVKVEVAKDHLEFSYKSVINPLEYCQLENTFYIFASVQYEYAGFKKQKFYSLDVRN